VDLSPANTSLVVPGARTLTLTLGTTEPVTENQYAGGAVLVSNGAGYGKRFIIDGHAAGDGGANVVFTLKSADAIDFSANSVTRFDLSLNKYRGVAVAANASFTAPVVGVAVAPAPNAQFTWVQTSGDAAINTSGTPGAGLLVVRATAGLSGQVEVANSTNVWLNQNIGHMNTVGVTGKAKSIKLIPLN
jgi:hypothetical protein